MFTYCSNNPVIHFDHSGYSWVELYDYRSLNGRIGNYGDLRQLTRGTGLEVHHLFEVRLINGNDILKTRIPSVRNSPAVVLSHKELVEITNALRAKLSYGNSYDRMTFSETEGYYAGVYGAYDHDDWIFAMFH